jgi:hypothetical protein
MRTPIKLSSSYKRISWGRIQAKRKNKSTTPMKSILHRSSESRFVRPSSWAASASLFHRRLSTLLSRKRITCAMSTNLINFFAVTSQLSAILDQLSEDFWETTSKNLTSIWTRDRKIITGSLCLSMSTSKNAEQPSTPSKRRNRMWWVTPKISTSKWSRLRTPKSLGKLILSWHSQWTSQNSQISSNLTDKPWSQT